MSSTDEDQSPPWRSWQRFTVKAVRCLALLALLFALAVGVALRSATLRQGLFELTASAIEESTGVRILARDFSLTLMRGRIVIDDLEVSAAASDAPPILTARQVEATVSWSSLLSDRIEVRKLRVEQPRVDFRAPLPETPAKTAPEDPDGSRGLDALEIEIIDAAIFSGPVPAELEMWFDSVRLEHAEVRGSFLADVLQLSLPAARLTVDSSRRPPIVAETQVSAEVATDGGFTVDALEIVGDGLELRLSGDGQLSQQGPLDFSIELAAEPPKLFPDLTSGGQLDARGTVTVADRIVTSDLELDVRQLPGELLIPGLALADTTGLDLTGTLFDVDADLQTSVALAKLDSDPIDQLAGHADLVWSNEIERLATASLTALDEPASIGFAFKTTVLPDEIGQRQFGGELRAPSWLDLEDGRLRRTRLDATVLDLAAAADRLGLTVAPEDFNLLGDLQIQGGAEGPLTSPEIHLTTRWQLDEEPLLDAELRSTGGVGAGLPLRLSVTAAILPETPGRRELTGEILAPNTAGVIAGDLQNARLDKSSLELEIPHFDEAMEDLRGYWRRFFPHRDLPAAWVEGAIPAGLLIGELDVNATGSGPVLSPNIELSAAWQPRAGESVRLATRGQASIVAPYFQGEATAKLDVTQFDLDRLATPGVTGLIESSFEFSGSPETHDTTLSFTGRNLTFGEGFGLDRIELAARSNRDAVTISRLDGVATSGQPFSGQGQFMLGQQPTEALLREGRLELELLRPVAELATIERAVVSLELDGGTVNAEVAFQETSRPLRPVATVRLPLGAFEAQPELAEAIARVPVARDAGEIWIGLAGFELEPFLPLLELAEDAITPHATLNGSLTLDLTDLVASSGMIDITDLAIENPDGRLVAEETLRLVLADRRLELLPAHLISSISGARGLVAQGFFELNADWQLGDPPESLVANTDLSFAGTFDTSQLNPMLGGGVATGDAAMRLEIRGPLSELSAAGLYDGGGSSLYFGTPYATRLEGPRLKLVRRRGGTALEQFQVRLNDGTVEATGEITTERGLDLTVELADVRYRVDYGLSTRSSGKVQLLWPAGGSRGNLTGEIVLERGTLNRDLDLDRGIRSLLFAPDLTSTEGTDLTDALDLDLSLISAEGVRIKNNLADMRADWNRLRIRGTLQNPVISGRIEVDPGGKITAYGQEVRLDEAAIALSGDPLVSPRVVLKTTNSFNDPSVRQNGQGLSQTNLGDAGPGAGGYWDRQAAAQNSSVSGELTGGLMTYYSDQIAGSLASGLKSTELSLEPLPIFGETDTQARLTATYRASPNADLIYSVNPRDAEGQTYLLDLHDFDFVPSLTAQVFTNDQNNEGLTLVHRLERGGGPRLEHAPRLREVEMVTPEGISRRKLRKAIGLRKGDPFPEDGSFDIEIDTLEELRRQGYPGGAAKVIVEDAPRSRLDVGITVESGPAVEFIFEGDSPARRDRRRIVQSYRTVDEKTALEEVERETVKALRGQGFLHPTVTAVAEHSDPSDDNAPRTVRIHAIGGRKIDPQSLTIEGVPEEIAAEVVTLFASRLNRVELAAEVPGADHYLIRSLRALGYGEAGIASRELSEDGKQLVVHIEVGTLDHLARVEIRGVDDETAERLRTNLPPGVGLGDPVRSDFITRAVHAIEDDLRARGYARANVRTHLEAATAEQPHDLLLRFTVEPGPLHHLDDVQMQGLRGTRPRWASHVAGLEPDTIFNEQELDEARLKLWRTGLFDRVRTTTQNIPADAPQGGAPQGGAPQAEANTRVVFELDEKPRYLFAYGGRWEKGEGIGLVADAIDRNFLGRGTTLGLRAIYSGNEDRSLRLYHVTPRIRGSSSTLEVFLEGKNETTEDLLVDSIEGWAQLTFPISQRANNRVYFRYQDLFVKDLPSPGNVLDTTAERLVIPSFGWQLSYDTRDQAFGNQRADGLSFGLDLTLTDENLGSDFSAFGAFAQLKLFRSFSLGRPSSSPLTWAQSLRTGFLEPFESIRIPFVTRLRAGGEYSIRGYRTEGLGPIDEEGNSLGGEVLLILNEEFHFPLWGETLGGLVFFDAGNVWETSDTLDSEIFKSFGAGLRAATPAGPLRLDIAFPLDQRDGVDDDYKIYLGFGNVF